MDIDETGLREEYWRIVRTGDAAAYVQWLSGLTPDERAYAGILYGESVQQLEVVAKALSTFFDGLAAQLKPYMDVLEQLQPELEEATT